MVSLVLAAVVALGYLACPASSASALYADLPVQFAAVINQIDTGNQGSGELLYATPALFGSNFYRDLLTGYLVWAGDGSMEDGESAEWGCTQSGAGFDIASNPAWNSLYTMGLPVILMVRRGSPLGSTIKCYFDQKVWNAQRSGGKVIAVLVIDDQVSELIYMRDNGLGSQITIPSFFLNRRYAQPVLNYWNNSNSKNSPLDTQMSLEFYLPNPDNRVEIDYYYSVADDNSVPFLTQFGTVARTLTGSHLWVQPHPFIFDGTSQCKIGSACTDLCRSTTGSGEPLYYCSPSQSNKQSAYYDVKGKDIVIEALRQYCMYDRVQFVSDVPTANQLLWTYWEMFYGWNDYPLTKADWSDDSAKRVQAIFAKLENFGFPLSYDKIQTCMTDEMGKSGGSPLLNAAVANWTQVGPLAPPTVYLNGQTYYGSPRCPTPITAGTCGIVSGICYGYVDNEIPVACKYPINCPFGQQDCNDDVDNSSTGITAGAVVGIVIGFIILTIFFAWLYLRYYKQRMRQDVDVLLQQYLPMDPGATHGVQSNHKVREAQEKRLMADMDLEDQALETSDF